MSYFYLNQYYFVILTKLNYPKQNQYLKMDFGFITVDKNILTESISLKI